jgi:ATP-dependent Clp protease adapter protein ClpS
MKLEIFVIFFLLLLVEYAVGFHFQQATSRVSLQRNTKMTTVAPPRPKTTKKPAPEVSESPDIIFKESRDVQKEFEEYFDNNNYYCILFDDPFNKRQYVASVLMQVFSWTEAFANEVMMTAHNTGFAVTGEYAKDKAEEYADELKKHNLQAAAIPVKGEGEGDCSADV